MSRLPKCMKPLVTQKHTKSWIYRYCYRIVLIKESELRQVINDGKISISQDIANKLGCVKTHSFWLAAVSWLVQNNHPLREFETPAFLQLLAAA